MPETTKEEAQEKKLSPEEQEILEARKWYHEAQIMWAQGRSLDALSRYEEALKVFLKHKLYNEAANAVEKVGDIQFWRGNFAKALKPYKMALDICEEFGDEIGAAVMAEKIIYTYKKMDQYEKALPYLYRVLELAEKFGDAHRAARMLAGIGDVKLRLGEKETALEAYELAAKIYRGLGSLEQAKLVEEALATLRNELDAGEVPPEGGG